MLSIAISVETSAIIYLFKKLIDSGKEKQEMTVEFGNKQLEFQEKTIKEVQAVYQDYYNKRFAEMDKNRNEEIDKAVKVNDSALKVFNTVTQSANKKINTINKIVKK